MIYGLYSIRDVKTGFMTPVMEANDDSAARNFYHAVQNSDGILFTFAQDFTLYKVAEFDSATGEIIPVSPIAHVADGSAAAAAFRKGEA